MQIYVLTKTAHTGIFECPLCNQRCCLQTCESLNNYDIEYCYYCGKYCIFGHSDECRYCKPLTRFCSIECNKNFHNSKETSKFFLHFLKMNN